jgi:hypothetical protein
MTTRREFITLPAAQRRRGRWRRAQQAGKLPKIGFLGSGSASG